MSSASCSQAEASMRKPSESSHSSTVIGDVPPSTQPDGTPVMPSAASRCAFEHDDGDVAAGLGLVVVVGGPRRRHDPPQLGLLFGRCGTGAGGEDLVAHLQLDIGVLEEVEVPG